jgi:hypothetical protein
LQPSKPLERRTGLARTGRLKARSAKTAKFYREVRAPLVARLLAERPRCEARIGCSGASADVHEIVSRARGGSLVDEANLACVCRDCHTYLTDNPLAAEALGLSKHSWER